MITISKWAMTALCATLLVGCGSSKDKAEELVKVMDLDTQYKMVIQVATAGYSSKYRDLSSAQIKTVIEDNIPKELLNDTLVEVYADHFDADELELMIEANKHPEKAMAVILGSKGGMDLAKKSMEVQSELQRDMAKAFEDRDEDIVDELDDLQKEARG